MKSQSRRGFIRTSLGGAAGLALLPSIIPSRLLGADAPSKKINIAQIGCGRMGRSDMGNILTEPLARVVAVCDLDSHRLAEGRAMAENYYTKQGETGVKVKTYHDYHDILSSPDIDAVVVTVPDHSHALVAIEAALAGKHIYVQKPVTYNIVESIALRRAVEAKKIILQTGSQQRSERPWKSFRTASEAVRNGRIGQLQTIKIGVGLDKPSGHAPAPMPVPANLDFERWLGSAPEQAYMERRVHPQNALEGRPGWITTEDFGLGMITNWGAHHIDIAHWAMGQELGGPLTVDAHAKFMQNDAWTVHTTYHVEMLYPKNVQVVLDNKNENGIRFEGDEGWVFCSRSDEKVTASDPITATERESLKPLRASDKKILLPLDDNAVRWMPSRTHHGNWLESIVANRQPIAPIQQSARSLQACAAAWISMKLERKLTWDVATEMFTGDDAANAYRSRKSRKPEYDIELILKKAGIA
ncbi:MAG TPA: Gfo/Idh/MocA family oxidoreductase [Verrucomicrobiae bacterium]|nr:Gfo/Idh/MocA family oxidoreductase [Verrucomicrobiae bacterium]